MLTYPSAFLFVKPELWFSLTAYNQVVRLQCPRLCRH